VGSILTLSKTEKWTPALCRDSKVAFIAGKPEQGEPNYFVKKSLYFSSSNSKFPNTNTDRQ
jgi:hypothetical protein